MRECGPAIRGWLEIDNEWNVRSRLLFLICPPLAVVVYLMLKMLRIALTVRTENPVHG